MRKSSSESYQAEAEDAVKRTANIPDFGYSGDLPLGETWAFTITANRSLINHDGLPNDITVRRAKKS